MNIKKYIVLTEEGVHDYNLEVESTDDGDKYSIFASESGDWVEDVKGTLLLSMTDDGAGITFNKNLKKIEYYDSTYLLILLKLRTAFDEVSEGKFKIIENKEVIVI